MNTDTRVLVVKDSEGIIRPETGIWVNDDFGRMSADTFLAKPRNRNLKVVPAILKEE